MALIYRESFADLAFRAKTSWNIFKRAEPGLRAMMNHFNSRLDMDFGATRS